MSYLPLNMTLYLLFGRCWPIVCTPSEAFCNRHKLCIPGSVCILLTALTYPRWYTRLPLVHLLQGSYQRFTWLCHQSQGISLVVLCLILRVWHSAPNIFMVLIQRINAPNIPFSYLCTYFMFQCPTYNLIAT